MQDWDESVTEDALFGSGVHAELPDLSQQLQFLIADIEVPEVRMREIQVTGDLVDGPSDTSPPVPTAAPTDPRRRIVDVRRPDPTLPSPSEVTDLTLPGLRCEGGGARPREVLDTGRDQGARKKLLKNKENIDKNSGRASSHQQSPPQPGPEQGRMVSRLTARSSNTNTFQPKLQLKKYDNDMPKKVMNSDKDRKQSRNIALNGSSPSDVRYVNDSPIDESLTFEQDHTCGPHCRHVNDSPPSDIEETVVLPGSHQRPSRRLRHRAAARQSNHETEEDFNSVHGRVLSDPDQEENEVEETSLKIVQTDGLERLQNNLWGAGEPQSSEKPKNLTRISIDKSSLNQALVHDVEADGYQVSPTQNLYVKLGTQSDGNAPIDHSQTSPIVVSYDHNRQASRPLNGVQIQRGENTSPFTVAAADTHGNGDSVMTYDSLRPSCLFGEGESDSMLAQRLQRTYDREAEEAQYQQGFDICPTHIYYQRGENPLDDDESLSGGPLVLSESGDFLHNDLYNPGDTESDTRPAGFRVRYGLLNEDETGDQPPLTLPAPVQVAPYPQQETESMQSSLHGPSSVYVEEDDETLARRLQEELDEQMARQLQETEDPTPIGVDDSPIYGRRRRYSSDDAADEFSVHPEHRNTWQNRPLTVEPTPRGRSVADSRGYNTWQRPLQHRHHGYQFQGHNQYDRLSFLDNIQSVEDGYDIPPAGVDYYLRYENDPEAVYGDDRLISINRDPQLLVSLLMDRDPGMRIPDSIDLNDYEALWELAENLGEVRRVGMDASEISLLPVHTFKASATATEGRGNTTDCLVCLSEFTDGEQLRTLPCCHIYHVDCIDEWLKRNAICPVCRQSPLQKD